MPLTLPVTPLGRAGAEGSGMTPNAKRPRARPPALTPDVTAMSMEDLTTAFYAFLGQFQAEQIFVDDINNVVTSHADDLDGFKNTYVELKKENINHEENIRALYAKQDQFEFEVTRRMENMTIVMKESASETVAHVQAGVIVDQKELYH